tara:strand:- start:840 stop:1604 length:765 start_codon:yes stop_codon:yes gene_type:complete
MSTLAFIPARSGSKGVVDKNIRRLDNVPLLAYSVYIAELCKEMNIFSEVIVSTDSRDYLESIKPLGYKNDYLRPSSLAGDNSPTIDAAIHALKHYAKKNIFFDNIMILQPTSPFRNVSQIKEAIDLISSNTKATCVTSVYKLGDYHPRRIKLINKNGFLEDFCREYKEPEPSRRQDFSPDAFIRSGSIYLSKTKQLIENGLIRGSHVLPLEVSEVFSINVDEELDFFKAEVVMNSGKFKEELRLFNSLKALYET